LVVENPDSLVLDTHVWLWLMEGATSLRGSLVDAIEKAASSAGLFLSAISVWEIAVLQAVGRVTFSVPASDWLGEALCTPGLQVVGIDETIALEGVGLPGEFPGDQPDRIITATARVRQAGLVTADTRLIRYGEAGHVRVVPVD
jgi:PIN domain nuclease of toxin-antitoxin system